MKLPALVLSVCLLACSAFAHVRVKPNQSQPGVIENYVLRVPSEGGRTTTSVTLQTPEGVTVVSATAPAAVPTTKVDQKLTGTKVVEVTWTLEIKPDDAVELPFVVRNPPAGETIVWKATQRYADGTSILWAGPKGDKTPAAVTTLGAAETK